MHLRSSLFLRNWHSFSILIVLLVSSIAHAGTFTAFGAKSYVRPTGDPVTVTDTFAVHNPNTQYTLRLTNGLQDGTTELVSSTVITVNGVTVVAPSDLSQNVTALNKPVTLQASNTISVQVRGAPGGQLSVQIFGVDNDLPTITASASPAANAANWNNTNVTVSFACADATSGVATCQAPITVTTEGAAQVITGTAVDLAGNTASASVTLNIDKTAPGITATPSPVPNAAGWNNTGVTVNFACSDALSGVATCPAPASVTTEGASQMASGTAVDVAGNSASTSATLKIDKSPPVLSIASPANASTVSTSTLQVTGNVSDALSAIASVSCGGIAATIQTGSFSCSVILAVGPNTIAVVATDVAGNTLSSSLSVTLGGQPTITDFSPKSAPVGTLVTVTGTNFIPAGGGNPQVRLNQQGGGTIAAPISSFTATSLSFVIPSGADSGTFTITAGPQSTTSAVALAIVAPSSFGLTATPATANLIQGQAIKYAVTLNSTNGFSQLAALAISGVPAGISASFSPQQITAGQTAVLTLTAPAGQATGLAPFTVSASSMVNGIQVSQSANLNVNVQPVTTSFLGRTVVQDPTETPLAGVTVKILGVDGNSNPTTCSGQTVSDAAGNFMITNLPAGCVGAQLIRYDGSTATNPAGVYAGVDLLYTFTAGQVTKPPITIHLPRVDNAETVMVKQNAVFDQTFKFKTIPNLVATVYAGTTLTLGDGTQPDPFPLIAVQVPVDRLPDEMPMNSSTVGAFIVAFQPANSVASQPVAVTFPNTLNTPPGVQMELDTLNPTKGVMVAYGTGTVSGDGTAIVPDFDPAHSGHRFGLVHFDWHGPMAPAPNAVNPCPNPPCKAGGDPVDLSSGLLVVSKTDIAFGGARGTVAIERTYRTLSGTPGPFGVGTNHNYGYQLNVLNFLNGQGIISLIMPDGNQFAFNLQADGTLVNSTVPTLRGAVLTNPGTGKFNLRWKDGILYTFQLPSAFARVAYLGSVTDSNGNTTTMVRGNTAVPIEITQIIDPVGRPLNLAYDGFSRITSIVDPIGRTVTYTYNGQGTLATVTDPAGGVTTYAYDGQNRMTDITDPRGILFLHNDYDSNGKVVQQIAADGGITKFAYTLLNPTVSVSFSSGATGGGGGGVLILGASNINTSPVILTTVTDPLGNQTTYHFSPQGFLLDTADALGAKTIYNRDPGTGLLLGVTDSLGRTTAFAYDSLGNTTSVTRLAGTANPVTSLYVYEPGFNKIASITDPLKGSINFRYDQAGNLLSTTDPLGNETTFAYDASGELIVTTDPLGNATRFSYLNGELSQVTDPLGRVTTRVTDAVGRLTRVANALEQASTYEYNPLNQITKVTDPLGGSTGFSYDRNGNLLSVIDAQNHKTTYSYDNMDRLAARTDALQHSESYQYNQNGNLATFTDRRGVPVKYTYDALNRRVQVQFGNESSISYVYDAAGRLVQAVDSITGSVVRAYDGLDGLVKEATSNGLVFYSYDGAGRRANMQVSGQLPVRYSYDAANRLTQITQSVTTVSFNYDADGRRISATLPNGVSANYTYNAASQLIGIDYGILGNLTYTYDSAGHRIATGGSFARSGLPGAFANASYDAGNEMTNVGGLPISYDPNGNMLTDGANTFTWNARNQLATLNGSTLGYDAFGRRIQNAAGTAFVYDGVNPIEELTNGVTHATLLAGLRPDEYFQRTENSAVNYLTDAQGSTIALTSSTGTPLASYTYDPFGKTALVGSSTNSFQFTGREAEGNDLYYYRARYYSPTIGRFISQDPSGFRSGSADFYSYTLDSPTNLRDSSGKNPACLVGGLLGTIGYNGYVIYQSLAGRKANYYAGWSGLGHILYGNATAFGAGCAAFSFGEGLLQAGLEVPESTGALYGGGNGAALQAAQDSGLNIISDTPVGSLANNIVPNSWTPVWDYLSSLYADGLTGQVTVFQGEMSEAQFANSILINTELPIVQANVGTTVTDIVMGAIPK